MLIPMPAALEDLNTVARQRESWVTTADATIGALYSGCSM